MSIPIYLSVSAEEAPRARAAGFPAAQYGCRLSAASPALLAPDPPGGASTLLLLRDETAPSYEPDEAIARMLAAYVRGSYAGLVCNWPDMPFFRTLSGLLDEACAIEHIPLWLPESCADASLDALALIGSDTSRGFFKSRMAEAAARFPKRCILFLRPLRAIFRLPCPDGGEALDADAARSLQGGASVFFSDDLLCKYFEVEGEDALVLYDDRETVQKKLEAAEAAGFVAALAPFELLPLLT